MDRGRPTHRIGTIDVTNGERFHEEVDKGTCR